MKRPSFLWLSPALTALGRKFGFDAHYYAKNSLLVFVGYAVEICRGIISGYIVARLFQKEIYGQYQFILSFVGMLTVFGLPGLITAVSRAWARGDAFSLRVITKYHLKSCLIGSLILIGCIPFLGYYGRENLWPLFIAAAVLFPLPAISMMHFGSPTVGRARFDIALWASIVWSSLMIIASLAIVFLHQSALLILIAGLGIQPLVYLLFSRKLRPPAEGRELKNTKAIVRYGWQLTIVTLPVNLVWYVDKILISHFLGLNQLATFTVAILLPEKVKMLIKQFFPITFPKQAKGHDSSDRRRQLTRAVLIGTGVFAAGIAVYIVLCPFLIPFLFPLYDAAEVILISSIAAATLITTPGTLFAQYLEAQGMIRETQIANWAAAAIFAVALVTLIPLFGLVGAIVARGIFRFAYVFTAWWLVVRTPIKKEAWQGIPITDVPTAD